MSPHETAVDYFELDAEETSVWDRLRLAQSANEDRVTLTDVELQELLEFAPAALEIDPDYERRRGFDEDFLASGFPLPSWADLKHDVALSPQGETVIRYHHFSVVMSRSRRFALFSAANLDGRRRQTVIRAGDRWIVDRRLPNGQIGNELYRRNRFDRGHLTRRADVCWGETLREALLANNDTFHYTNCAPQHERFNQNEETWQGLEDYILSRVSDRKLRVDVVTGPILRDTDPLYRDARLPVAFWKVVATDSDEGRLHTTAYVLSQKDLLRDIEAEAVAEPPFGPFKTFQVPVAELERLTHLDFGPARGADAMAAAALEALSQEIRTTSDIVV